MKSTLAKKQLPLSINWQAVRAWVGCLGTSGCKGEGPDTSKEL